MNVITYCPYGSYILEDAFKKFYSPKNKYYIFVGCPQNSKTKPRIAERYTRVLDPDFPGIIPMGEFHRGAQHRLPGTSLCHALSLRDEFIQMGVKKLMIAINEGGHGVRSSDPTARKDLIEIAHGLYVGEAPFKRSVLFQEGPGYTTKLNHWKGVDYWLNDKAFWAGMEKFVQWYCSEVYIGPEEFLKWDSKQRDSWLFGSLLRAREIKSPAAKVLNKIYAPLISCFWIAKSGYRNTCVPLGMMKLFCQIQMDIVYARKWPVIAISWNERSANKSKKDIQNLAETIAKELYDNA